MYELLFRITYILKVYAVFCDKINSFTKLLSCLGTCISIDIGHVHYIYQSYTFFQPPTGADNLWELVSVAKGLDDSLLSERYKKGIMHVKHLTKFKAVSE